MFINAIIEIGASETTALPQQAVVQSGGRNYIFILDEDKSNVEASENAKGRDTTTDKHIKFKRIEVGTTVTENGFTGVLLPSNFDMESKVVTKGAYDLLSKMNNTEEEE